MARRQKTGDLRLNASADKQPRFNVPLPFAYRPSFRQRLLGTTALVGFVVIGGMAEPSLANPTGGNVVAGSATISQPTSAVTEIHQQSNRAIFEWQTFSIDAGQRTQFFQPSASSVALNRVLGGDPSRIAGQLIANGNLVLVNHSGIFFGKGSQVDVGGLIATTTDIRNDNFMAGIMKFDIPSTNPNATVTNEGQITIRDGGFAALVAPGVANSGVITAKLGKVTLAGAETFTVDLYGDGLISFDVGNKVAQIPTSVDGTPASALVSNTGQISADGGSIQLTANAIDGILTDLVHAGGTLQANTLGIQAGSVLVDGGAATGGTVVASGAINATGLGAGQTGGTVALLGDRVGVLSGAAIDASGDAGGGTILVGGNFHGAGPQQNATATVVQQGASLKADAVSNGDGGKVAVWSNSATSFNGSVSARGGAKGGKGGLIETSSKGRLDVAGATVNASAARGAAGLWLIDPTDVVIDNTTTSTHFTLTGKVFSDDGTDATAHLNANLLAGTLNGGTDVVVTTASTNAAPPNGGDITVSQAVTWTTANTLGLFATTDIKLGASLTGTTGGLALQAGTNVTQSAGQINVANLSMVAGTGIGSSAAQIALAPTQAMNLAAKTATGGIFFSGSTAQTITVGQVTLAANPFTGNGFTSPITGLSATTSGDIALKNAGSIVLNQNVVAQSGNVFLEAAGTNAKISTTGGNITLGGANSISLVANAGIGANVSGQLIQVTDAGGAVTLAAQTATGGVFVAAADASVNGLTIGAQAAVPTGFTAITGGGGVSSASGDIVLQNTGDLAVTQAINNGTQTGAISLFADSAGAGVGELAIGAAVGNAAAGDVTLSGATIAIGVGVNGGHNLFIQPSTAASTIAIGGAAVGTFALSSASLGFIDNGIAGSTLATDTSFSGITIGRTDGTGAVDVNNGATGPLSFTHALTVQSPGTGGTVAVHTALSDSGALSLQAGAAVGISAPVSTTNAALALSTTAGKAGDIVVAATLNSGSGTLTVSADHNLTLTAAGTVGATTTGTITLSADASGTGTGALATNAKVGNAAAGDITLSGATISIGDTVDGAHNLNLKPSTAASTIAIGNAATGIFALNAASLGNIGTHFNLVTIGRSDGTGAIDVKNGAGLNFARALTIESPALGGTINVESALADSQALTLLAGGNAGTAIAVNASVTTTGASPLTLTTTVGDKGDIVIGGPLDSGSGPIVVSADRNLTVNGTVGANTTGTITLSADTGVGGNGTGTGALAIAATVGNSTAGDVTLSGATMNIGAPVNGAGNLLIEPSTAASSIAIGDFAFGTFALGTTSLGNIGPNFAHVTIGRSDGTGAIDIRNLLLPSPPFVFFASPLNSNQALTIQSPGLGGTILVETALSDSQALTLVAGGNAGAAITVNAALSTSGTAPLTLTTTATDHGDIVIGGSLDSGSGAITVSADRNVTVNGTIGAATTGTIALTADAAGTGTGALAINAGVGNAAAGDVTLSSASINIAAKVDGSGTLLIEPSTAGSSIAIGDNFGGAPAAFTLNNASLSHLGGASVTTDGFGDFLSVDNIGADFRGVTIGRANGTGPVTVFTEAFNLPIILGIPTLIITVPTLNFAAPLTVQSGSAAGTITVNSVLSDSAAGTGLTLLAGGTAGATAVAVNAAVTATNNAAITATAGDIVLTNTVSSTAGNVTLSALQGTVTETGGSVTAAAGTLTAQTQNDTVLNSAANNVGALTANVSAGGFNFTNQGTLTVDTVTATADVGLVSTNGSINLAQTVSGANVSLSAALGAVTETTGNVIAGAGAGLLTVQAQNTSILNALTNNAGAVTANVTAGGFNYTNQGTLTVDNVLATGDVGLVSTNGTLTLAQTVNGANVTLSALQGAVTETTGNVIAGAGAGLLTVLAQNTSSLNALTNNVGAVTANVTAGGFNYTNLLNLTVDAVTATGDIGLVSTNGSLSLAQTVNGANVSLSALQGAVNETNAGANVIAGAGNGTLTVLARDASALIAPTNSVGALTANVAAGGFTYINVGNLNVGNVAAAGNVTLLSTNGTLNLLQTVTGPNVALSAAQGAVTESGGNVVAGSLVVQAHDASALNTGSNNVGVLTASVTAGGFSFTNLGTLTVNNVTATANVGLVSTNGTLNLAQTVSGANVSLSAVQGAVSEINPTANVVAGGGAGLLTVQARDPSTLNMVTNNVGVLTANVTAGGFNYTNFGNLTVDNVTAAANVGLVSATGSLTLAQTVNGANVTLSALQGAVIGTAGNVIAGGGAGLLTVQARDPSLLTSAANSAGALTATVTAGGLTYVNLGNLTVDAVTAATDVALRAANGSLSLAQNVTSTAGNVFLEADGAGSSIVNTGGIVTLGGGSLSLVANAGIGATGQSIAVNDVGGTITLAAQSATGSVFVIANDANGLTIGPQAPAPAGFTTIAAGVSAAGTVALRNNTGSITLAQNVSAGTGDVLLEAGGAVSTITTTGGTVTFGAGLHDLSLVAGLQIGTQAAPLLATDAGGTIGLGAHAAGAVFVSATDPSGLTLGAVHALAVPAGFSGASDVAAGGNVLIQNTAGITVAQGVNTAGQTGTITLAADTAHTGTALTVNAPVGSATAGTMTLSGGTIDLESNVTSGGIVALNATGTIVQNAGIIAANTLTGSSAGGATLNRPNQVTNLGLFTNATGGDLSFTDALGLTTTATVTSAGNLKLNTSGNLVLSSNLTSSGGTPANGTVTLQASGTITQAAGTIITANTLTGNSTGGASLTGANQVANLGAFTNATSGALSFTDARTLTTTAPISSAGNTTLTTTGAASNLILKDNVISTGGTVKLTAGGTITQNSGAITANTLTGSSGGTTSLLGQNKVATFGSFTAGGDLSFIDNSAALTLAGPLTAGGTMTIIATSGPITIPTGVTMSAGTAIELATSSSFTQTGTLTITNTPVFAVAAVSGAVAPSDFPNFTGAVDIPTALSNATRLQTGTGAVHFDALSATSSSLLIWSGTGAISGHVDVAQLGVFGTAGTASMNGSIGGVSGPAAAGRGIHVVHPDNNSRFNDCAIGSLNCIVLPQFVPVIIPPINTLTLQQTPPTSDPLDIDRLNTGNEDSL